MFTPDGPATRTPNWPQKTLPDLGLCSAKNNCQTAPDHQTKERRSQAFNANIQRRPLRSEAEKRPSGGGPSGPERTEMVGYVTKA